MSKAKFDDDVERIMNEVENFDLDDIGEEGVSDVDVDDLLKDYKNENPDPVSPFPDYGDPLNIMDSSVRFKEEKPKLDSTKHPLKVIEEHETDISSKLGGQANLDSKFLVLNYEKKNDTKLPNVTYRTLESVSDYCFPDEANAISAYDAEAWGNPKCIAVYPDKYIAVGTSRSRILIFPYGETTPRILGGAKEAEYGAVTAMDLSQREDCLITGHESGHIILWKVDRNELQRAIPPADKSPVISVRFWKEGRSNVISSTARGIVHLHTFVYSFFQWTTDKKVLIDAAAAAEKRAKSNEIDPFAHLPDGFFDIQILRRELTRHHSLSKYTVAALVSMKMVLIITLEPVVGSVFKYVRPDNIHDLIVPSISWGRGALPEQDGNRHPVLAMSWGREIFLLQCQNVEDAEAKGIKFAGIYESKYDIFHIDWISESNLLVYDYSREFKILYTESFNTINNAKFTESKFDYEKAVISSQALDPDISFQIYPLEKNTRNNRPILYYTNTLITNQFPRRVFVLGYKRMYIGRHFEWKEHIQEFVNQKEWLPAFALFVSFAQGKNKTFAGLPIKSQERKDVIREYGAEVVSNYITAIRDENGPPELTTIVKVWKTVVLIVIDLLVSIENYEYLFKEIKRQFENFGIQDLFMSSLETFIFRNRIKYIPNEPFREVVKYYTEKDRISVLQYLMVNIEMRGIDIDYAINLCMEYNLLTALFYFCSHREDSQGGADFLTPIARALTLCQKNITDKNAENNELGIKFLWFVSMTINGKMFPSGSIPNDIWEDKVRGVLVLIFEEINIELMLRIQPYVSFEIFKSLFEPKLTSLIASYDSSSIKLLADSSENRTSNNSTADQKEVLKLFSDALDSRIQAQMLTLIYCHCKKKGASKKIYTNLLYYFLADLAINLDYHLPEQIIQETLFFILENDREIPKWEAKEPQSPTLDDNDEEINPNMELRNTLLLGLLRRLEGKLKGSDFDKVQKVINQSDFIDVKAYLLGLNKDYQKCFELYLEHTSDSQKIKVFKWLDNLSQSLKTSRQEELKALKSVAMTHFRELVALSNEETRKVIQNLGEMFDIQAVSALEGSPRLQLNYVQGLLLQREIGIQIPDDILILHIKLLCQLHPKQVIEEVKKTTYPLDESLRIVKEYGLNNVAAFFLERAGNLHEALDITLDLFTKSTEKKLKKIEEHGLFHEEGLTKKLATVKEICNKNSKLGDSDTEKLWFKVLDRVLKNYLQYVMNNYKVQTALKKDSSALKDDSLRRFGRIYTEYVSVLFDDISRHIEVPSIAKKLAEYNKMTLRELGGPIVTMLEAYGTEEWIVKETDRLALDNMFNGLTNLYQTACKGFGSDVIDIDPDLVDTMAVFECRHSFPRNYIQTSHCLVCKEDDLTQAKAIVLRKGKQAQKALTALIKEPTSASTLSARESQDSHSDIIARTEALNEIGISPAAMQISPDDWREKHLRKLAIVDLSAQESVIDWDEKVVQKRSFG